MAEESSIKVADIESRLSALEKSELEQGVKDALTKKFEAAMDAVKSEEASRLKESEFSESIQLAPKETEQVLRRTGELPTVEEAVELEFPDDVEGLRKMLETRRASLGTLDSNLNAAQQQLERVRARPSEMSVRLPAAYDELAELNAKVAALPPAKATESFLKDSERMLLLAEREALSAEIGMLQQEQLSQEVRETLTLAKRDLSKRLVENEKAVVAAIEERLEKQRSEEAQQLKEQTLEMTDDLSGDGPAIRELGEELEALSGKVSRSASSLAEANRLQNEARRKLDVLNHELSRIKSQVELGGLEGGFSQRAIERLRALPNDRVVVLAINEHEKELSEVRLADLEAEQMVGDRALEDKLTSSTDPKVSRMLVLRGELIETLRANYLAHIRELTLLISNEQSFRSQVENFRVYLTGKLFWMKSSPPIGRSFFTDLPNAIKWVFSGKHGREGFVSIRQEVLNHPVQAGMVALLVIALLVIRPRIVSALKTCGHKSRRISTDAYRHTVKALGYTILLALPIPLVIGFLGWVVTRYSGDSEWVRGMGRGLGWVALIVVVSEFLRAVTRIGGLGDVHFRWDDDRMHKLRKVFSSIIIVYVPALLVVGTTVFNKSSDHFDSLGRLCFIISHLWIAFLVIRALRSERLKPADQEADTIFIGYTWLRTSASWMVGAAPVAMALLAAIGYFNTALALSFVYMGTLGIGILGLLVYAFILRWFMIKERRLKAEKMIEERRARRMVTDQVEDATDVPTIAPDDVELNLDDLGGQTRRLIFSLIFVGVVIGIWWFWSSALPLKTGMGSVTFGEGLTITDIVRAIMVVWVGGVVVKNLPGLMELAGLRDSSMDSGSRYALVTIVQYVATAIIAAMVFQIVDLDWSKFGWIAAALSVGLGFGLQEVVANFVCGIILLFERPIRIGDVVVVDGISGVVSRIRMRATTITNWDREDFVVPNKQFITGSLINCTLTSSINRVVVPVGVAYGSDIPTALRILGEVAEENPYVLDEPAPFTSFEQFGDSSLNLVLRCYLPDRDNRLRAITDLHAEINRRFKEAAIEIPFPQRDLHIRSQAGVETSL